MNDASNPPPSVALIGEALPHESAHLHVAGEATYIDDIVERGHTARRARRHLAHARIVALDLDAVLGVIVLTATGIPGSTIAAPCCTTIRYRRCTGNTSAADLAVAATSVKAAQAAACAR
jgi:xanthine dehydrogenase molybdopterin-binding subunit B